MRTRFYLLIAALTLFALESPSKVSAAVSPDTPPILKGACKKLYSSIRPYSGYANASTFPWSKAVFAVGDDGRGSQVCNFVYMASVIPQYILDQLGLNRSNLSLSDYKKIALFICNERKSADMECRIYAVGKKVVWEKGAPASVAVAPPVQPTAPASVAPQVSVPTGPGGFCSRTLPPAAASSDPGDMLLSKGLVAEAAEAYAAEARRGSNEAKIALGSLQWSYYNDVDKAKSLLLEASLGGNARAQYCLARLYQSDGSEAEKKAAIDLYRRAGNAGFRPAQVAMWQYYTVGALEFRDEVKAAYWAKKMSAWAGTMMEVNWGVYPGASKLPAPMPQYSETDPDALTCQRYGYSRGKPGFADCMMQIDMARQAQARADADYANQMAAYRQQQAAAEQRAREDRELRQLQIFFGMLAGVGANGPAQPAPYAAPPPPPNTRQTFRLPNGNQVYCQTIGGYTSCR
jgi:hypothetical protein